MWLQFYVGFKQLKTNKNLVFTFICISIFIKHIISKQSYRYLHIWVIHHIHKHLHLIRYFVCMQIIYQFYVLLTVIYGAILWPDLPHWGRNDPSTFIYLIVLTESVLTYTHIKHYKSGLWKTKQSLPNVLTQLGSFKYVIFSSTGLDTFHWFSLFLPISPSLSPFR